MWLSVREMFRQGDSAWAGYINFIHLPHLQEVRTIDMSLNPPYSAPVFVATYDRLSEAIGDLPAFDTTNHYIQLAMHCSEESMLGRSTTTITLLGYDIADSPELSVSSVLNCGPWRGQLTLFTDRLNQYGLLTHEDAIRAQALLPIERQDDRHAFDDIWAICEVVIP